MFLWHFWTDNCCGQGGEATVFEAPLSAHLKMVQAKPTVCSAILLWCGWLLDCQAAPWTSASPVSSVSRWEPWGSACTRPMINPRSPSSALWQSQNQDPETCRISAQRVSIMSSGLSSLSPSHCWNKVAAPDWAESKGTFGFWRLPVLWGPHACLCGDHWMGITFPTAPSPQLLKKNGLENFLSSCVWQEKNSRTQWK
jgi:hypothetical protein